MTVIKIGGARRARPGDRRPGARLPAWRAAEDLLTSVPGIGKITARTLIAELLELGRSTAGGSRRCSASPRSNRDSGVWRGQRAIAGGRAAVRNVLYVAALSATSWNPALRPFDLRLRQRGRAAKAALVAAMRKLLTILNTIMRDQRPWRST